MKKSNLAVLLLSLSLFSLAGNLKVNAHDDDGDRHEKSALATVNGIVVTKNDLKAKPTDTQTILDKRLGLAIRKIIYNETAKQFDVRVTNEEINEKWEKINNNSGAPIDSGAEFGIEAMLTEEKLNVKIDDEIAERNQDFAKYLYLVKNNPSSPEIQKIITRFANEHHATVLDYVEAQRALWWTARYKHADIDIIDRDYIGALAYVKP